MRFRWIHIRTTVPTQTPTSSISSPSSAGSTSPPDNNNRNDDDDDDDDDEREREKQKKAKKKEEPICSKGYIVQNGVTVELVSQELWKKFHKLGTEMIITKAGRYALYMYTVTPLITNHSGEAENSL